MSRVGSNPIELPQGVQVDVSSREVNVKGPKGALSVSFDDRISVAVEDGVVSLSRDSDERESKALHGLRPRPPREHGPRCI